MSSGTVARVALGVLTLGAVAVSWGVGAWRRRVRRREHEGGLRGEAAVPPGERREGPAPASRSGDEPCPVARCGWSLDLSDEP